MKAPGALVRIPVTLVDEADPARFEVVLETLAAADPQAGIKRTPDRERIILGVMREPQLEKRRVPTPPSVCGRPDRQFDAG